jgi:hypothetical protein
MAATASRKANVVGGMVMVASRPTAGSRVITTGRRSLNRAAFLATSPASGLCASWAALR